MPYALSIPNALKSQGWRVKIRDRECLEPPHVTIIHKTRQCRWGLRERAFLDKEPPPRDVPAVIIKVLVNGLDALITEWDRMFPENQVRSGPQA